MYCSRLSYPGINRVFSVLHFIAEPLCGENGAKVIWRHDLINRLENHHMFKRSDIFILLAVAVSFAVSGYLWFNGQQSEGLFTAMWVPSILAFGIYFKLSALAAKSE